ncbi:MULTISPECIES: DUF5681 domain-containing protein [Bradyrhizobium]|uniref:DUF5681 domain-containing protein n=1 Tax=Bradyrhizobium TaxID=374 RepID=UPI00155E9799|nr:MULTISPECIES: DUF5681 domain-containing protein [Bradyrhizobium]MDD1519218.1 hypothetical protein [Bradyrhizobium sp. WBAH30]MDD1543462.1 hypothetical protein [Bradyrhizobium sp. WBAH41]MDD1557592.1 hypothetical protein [Bradyrhizobium sp. WBAH23]MDD1565004.1 hypothetical protein [Bradyrhizobium sp. WBAH33]MDD1590412.1 hypothetical protein [Bradyrhizobium sp. WBAH42]
MTKRKSENYSVGYGKPPKARRFKPGQSGNPRGRPKKCLSLTELFAREMKRTRPIVEDGQRLRIQTDEVLVKRVVDLAVKGNVKVLTMTMKLIEQIREIESAKIERDYDAMSKEEARAAFVQLRDTVLAEFPRARGIADSFP